VHGLQFTLMLMACAWGNTQLGGATTHEGVDSVRRLYRFEDLLSREGMTIALKSEPDREDYRNLIIDRDTWWSHLVAGLLGE